ncbi:MAG: manganese efflux pump [Bacilli bacterium]|nr:manganese efflux pump [Bacilli bacterium]
MSLIFSIAVALSLDAFSVSLSLGTFEKNYKNYLKFALTVGIFHFIMPFLGSFTNHLLLRNLVINGNKLMGLILIVLAIQMLIELIRNKEEVFKLDFKEMLLLALSVSLDSYFTGIGLKSITNNLLLSFIIFSVVSSIFTFMGCVLGKFGKKYLGHYANGLAILLLLILGVKYLLF